MNLRADSSPGKVRYTLERTELSRSYLYSRNDVVTPNFFCVASVCVGASVARLQVRNVAFRARPFGEKYKLRGPFPGIGLSEKLTFFLQNID